MGRHIRGLRWWIISLVMAGTALNFLTRSTLGVAAPALMADLDIDAEQYSWITAAFQIGIMAQPITGWLLDVIGIRAGLALFAAAWGAITMAHGLAGGWRALAGLRGALGLAEFALCRMQAGQVAPVLDRLRREFQGLVERTPRDVEFTLLQGANARQTP